MSMDSVCYRSGPARVCAFHASQAGNWIPHTPDFEALPRGVAIRVNMNKAPGEPVGRGDLYSYASASIGSFRAALNAG